MVRALFRDIRVVTPGHQAACVGIAFFHRYLVDHGLDRGPLVLAAERHEHRTRSDGGVEPFGKAPLGADVQVCAGGLICVSESPLGLPVVTFWSCGLYGHMLAGSVGA